MLPPAPPPLSNRDFDPSTVEVDGDAELRTEEPEANVELSSVEINILIYLVGLQLLIIDMRARSSCGLVSQMARADFPAVPTRIQLPSYGFHPPFGIPASTLR